MDSKPSTDGYRLLAELPMVAMAVGFLALVWRTIWPRVQYGFDLEWMEGGMLLHASRVSQGLPLYVSPSADFIPFIYPPMYPWVVGGLSWLGLPLGYSLGRWVSVVSVLVAAGVLASAVRKEGGGWALGIGGAALFLATFPASGAFFDLVRNDGLQMGLIASAMFAVRSRSVRVGGLLLTAAFLTKHTAALYGICSLWWLFHHEGKVLARRFAFWSVGPALVATVWLSVGSDGRFLTYVLGVPSTHPFIAGRFFYTAPKEMLLALPWMTGALIVAGLMLRRVTSRGGRFWLAHGAMALFLSALMRGHHGGYLNVLMPGLWVMSLWSTLALQALRKRWPGLPLLVATSSLVAWQLWSAQWSLSRYVPTEADTAAGNAVVEQLAAIDGEILAPWQPWMVVQAGKTGNIALIALWDIDHEGGPFHKEAQSIAESIREKRWSAVLTAKSKLKRGLKKHYERTEFKKPKGRSLYPKTGWRVRPHDLWVPKAD